MVADGVGDDDLNDELPRNKFAKFNLDVSSSMASIVERPWIWAFRKAADTVMTFVASSRLMPSVFMV